MLLGRGQDEDDVRRRFLQRFQEGVEGCAAQHVHLIDDEDLVSPYLWRYLHLLDELPDVLDRVVAGCVQFVYVHGALLVEGAAALAFAAGISVALRVQAVNGLGKNPGTSGFTYSTRPAEEIGMSQLARGNGIFQCCGERALR